MKWSKNGWMIPAIIIFVNVCAIWIKWSALTDVLPAHFDPAGNASGSMAKTTLIFYPVISLMLCLVTYGIYALANNIFKLKSDEKGLRMCGLHVFASCLTLTVLSSTILLEPVNGLISILTVWTNLLLYLTVIVLSSTVTQIFLSGE